MFHDLSKNRYSVRDFSNQMISDSDLDLILEAGRLAPTAVNSQPQKIYVIKSKDSIEKIRKTTKMAYNAPIVLLVCYDSKRSWKSSYDKDAHDLGEMDCSIVTTEMMMQATELGIGTLWARGFNPEDISSAFDLPDNIIPVCLLDLGYPSETNKPADRHFERLPKEDTISYI